MSGAPFSEDPGRDVAEHLPALAEQAVAALKVGDRERSAKTVAAACAIWPRSRRDLLVCADELDRLRRRIAPLPRSDALVAVIDDALTRLDVRATEAVGADERARRSGPG